MLFLTGDECGLIKECNTASLRSRRKKEESSQYGIVAQPFIPDASSTGSAVTLQCLNSLDGMSRQHGIVRMVSLCNNSVHSEEMEFAALRMNGSIQLWKRRLPIADSIGASKNYEYENVTTTSNIFASKSNIDSSSRQSRPFSMGLISSQSSANGNGAPSKLALCNTSGTIVVVDPTLSMDSMDEETSDQGISMCFSLTGPKDQQSSTRSSSATNRVVSAFCTHSTNHWIAIGGKENDIVVYDAQSASSVPIWKAKNLPPHPQTLLQPQIWPTAACFLDELNAGTTETNQTNLLVVGSAYRQIRIYDLRMSQSVGTLKQTPNVQRRPILHTDEKQSIVDYRITAICPLSNHSFLIGDGGGTIISYDIRGLSENQLNQNTFSSSKNTAVLGRFVGPAGSVRQLTTLPGQNQFACVGYDRMLRIYDSNSRKQLHMIYLKQRLNSVLMLSSGGMDEESDSPEDDDIEREDHVQDYLDSEDDSVEDEDDIVEHMIKEQLMHVMDNEDPESEESDVDDYNDDVPRIPPKKGKWQ